MRNVLYYWYFKAIQW